MHRRLGPGLLESVYQAALAYELRKTGLRVREQVELPVTYDEVRLEVGCRLDLLIEESVIVELKSVDVLLNVHHKQLLTYLRLSNCKLGLLINFNADSLDDTNMVRKVNGW